MSAGWRTYHKVRHPQTMPIDAAQVANSAGGYSWRLDDWKRLERFLILGSEGGTFYIDQQTLTMENSLAVQRCIKNDGKRVVRRVV